MQRVFKFKLDSEISVQPQYIDWNGYKTSQTCLLYVFVDLTVHNAQTHSYIILISLTARNGVAFIYSVTICQQETTDFASAGSFQHKLQYRCFLFDQCLLSFITTGNKSTLSSVIDGFPLRRKM